MGKGQAKKYELWQKHYQISLLAVLCCLLFLLGEIVAPGFLTLAHIMTVLKIAALLGIFTLSQTLVIIAGGEGIDLSVGAVASIAAVFGAAILNGSDANLPLAILVIMGTGILIGALNGIGIAYFQIPPLVMTLAMASVVNGIIQIYSQGFLLKGRASALLIKLGSQSTAGIPNIIFIWIIITALAWAILGWTRAGIILYGVGSNKVTAELSGVKVKRVQAQAYIASGAVASLGGLLLLGYIGQAFMDIGSAYVLPSVAAAVIGGISLAGGSGNYLGAALGAVLLTTITSLLTTMRMGEAGKNIVTGLILLLILAIYTHRWAGLEKIFLQQEKLSSHEKDFTN